MEVVHLLKGAWRHEGGLGCQRARRLDLVANLDVVPDARRQPPHPAPPPAPACRARVDARPRSPSPVRIMRGVSWRALAGVVSPPEALAATRLDGEEAEHMRPKRILLLIVIFVVTAIAAAAQAGLMEDAPRTTAGGGPSGADAKGEDDVALEPEVEPCA